MLAVNEKRVEHLLQGLARFGAAEGQGVTRLAYSALDRQAQEWLLHEVRGLNLSVREDAVGNVFLRREGLAGELPPVACGSHLDTVIHGGAYDGMCGVVGALEALYMLQDTPLRRSVEVIIFRAEESSRFGFATVGSKLLTGKASLSEGKLAGAKDKDGVTLAEAVRSWGCEPENCAQARLESGAYKCFAELHIEQGKVLEETANEIGIVHNIAAPTRFKLHVQGLADHSGATPMGFRRDALVSAAKLVLAVQAAATAEKEHGTVATVGVLELEPASINVVPGAATLWTDLRGVDEASISRTLAAIRQAADSVAAEDKVSIVWEMLTADAPVALDAGLAQRLEAVCRAQKIKYLHMNSGAGHDAMHMAAIAPATMIFIPCRGGISHNPAEFAKTEDICRGIGVLAALLEQEAQE